MLSHFLDQWRSILAVQCEVAAGHHPIIQKEVDELLSKGAIEPSSGGAGFNSSVFVVLSILVASGPYLTLVV